MRRALIAILALYPVAGSAAVLWFGDKGGLHQIDTSVNRVVVDVAMEPPVAVAVNAADGSAWAVTQSRVLHVNSTGAIQFQVALKDLGSGLGAPRLVAINSNDASVWAGFENRVLHFDGDGALHQSIATAAADLTVAQDGSLWILTQSSVEQRDSSGTLVKSAVLSGAAKGAKRLALDDAGAALWVAGDKDLVKLSLSDPAQMLVALTAPQTTSAISLDMQSGDLWFLGQQGLYAFTRDGAPRISRDLRDFTISNPQALVFDAASQAAWVGHSQGLSRIATAGTLAASFSADAKTVAVAIGRMPLNITPIVAIVAPKDGALLNNATPQFSVTYDALCGATPCGFPGSFFKTFNLSAVINGTQLGSSFTFNSTSGGSTYTPATRLPEGQNSWTVVARDAFGHTSDSVTATFTVDTIAPQFQTVAPATNSSYTTPNVTITGTVDDTNATVSLGTQTQGPSFSFPIVLNPGDNNVTLNARDKAGNIGTLPLHYVYNRPPSIAITSPLDLANFEAPASFAITADASDPDGSVARVEFFVNGGSAGVDTTFPYAGSAANLALGTYVITAQATDDRGLVTTSAAVTVTVGPPNARPTVRLNSPANNTPFSAPASVKVVATASDSDGTIARVEFFRDGQLAATATSEPYVATLSDIAAGSHSIYARATDNRGGTTSTTPVTITVATTSLVISSPLPNASIDGATVLVQGRVEALSGSALSVGGSIASIDGFGNFYVTAQLAPGANTITAMLRTVDGNTLTQSVNVNATGTALPYAVTANKRAGLAPLAATFNVVNPTTTGVSFTFNGGGPYSLPAGGALQLSVTYPAGSWVNTFVFSSGQTYQIVVDSRDPARMDQMFRAIWSGMNSALVAGDKEGAIRYLNENAQAKFGPVFDALMPYMSDIVASYSPLVQGSISDSIGEYAVTRDDHGVKRIYFIYFLQSLDGVWRIDEM